MPVPGRVYLFLAVGLVAASQSGNLIRLGDAPPAAIAAWRLTLAALMLAPFAGSQLHLLRRLKRTDLWLLVLAGATLSAHLIAWTTAVQLTTVANASIFFTINPVLTGTAAFFVFGEPLTWRLLCSIGLGLSGAALIGWNDFSFDPTHIPGDLLALLCSALFTVYFLLGKRLRKILPTHVYVSAIYGVAGVVSFVAVGVLGQPGFAYSGQTWLAFLLLALIPTMIGHTALNNALRFINAGRISAATLCEPPLAGFVAYLAWGETISELTAAGYALIATSVLLLVLDRSSTPLNDLPREADPG